MLDSVAPQDLSKLSKSELKELERRVQEALVKADARRKKDALEAVEQAVKAFGLTLAEVLAVGAESKRSKVSVAKSAGDVKFRNPENPEETWSGRGRRPAWFKAHLEAGRSEDDFRV